ncbi:hypothetical protein [Tsuneonella rigui]|uniref:hypothetical protein n=1 Tax=Tsuneonella rigui TaxID=1708790 RepID=UPI000F7E0821|nr:hypothetical protein [Tsuneonella rigui]
MTVHVPADHARDRAWSDARNHLDHSARRLTDLCRSGATAIGAIEAELQAWIDSLRCQGFSASMPPEERAQLAWQIAIWCIHGDRGSAYQLIRQLLAMLITRRDNPSTAGVKSRPQRG